MRKLFIFCFTIFVANCLAQCPWSFTITNITGTYTITCTNPTINLSASNNNTNTVNYLWSGPAFTSSLANVVVSQAGNYSLAATDAITGCSMTQVFTVGVNTLAPTNSVNPLSYSITCISNSMSYTGTAISPNSGIQNDWYSPIAPYPGGSPIVTGTNSICIFNGIGAPGVHQFVTTNLTNGCSSVINVTIASIVAYPTFSVSSSNNYSVGCTTNTLSFTNVISNQSPPAPVSYTFLAPSFTGSVPQGIFLNSNPSLVVNTPGTWTMIAQDNSNFCRTEIGVVLLQNTLVANFTHTVGGAGLVFFTSTSTGTTGGTAYSWDFGDGTTGTGVSTSHTYSNGGIHNVVLNTTNPNCNTANVPINVNTLPCTANSNYSLAYSGTPQNWLASPAYYGNITNAVWNWGDGNSDNTLFTSHTYSAAGFYNICLSVTVSCANTSSFCSNYNIYKTMQTAINPDMAMVTVSVVPKIITGLKTNTLDENLFNLYPNPTNSTIYIQNPSLKSGTIKVFNFEGKEINSLLLERSKETKIESLNAGVYFVEIKVENEFYRKKIVVL